MGWLRRAWQRCVQPGLPPQPYRSPGQGGEGHWAGVQAECVVLRRRLGWLAGMVHCTVAGELAWCLLGSRAVSASRSRLNAVVAPLQGPGLSAMS